MRPSVRGYGWKEVGCVQEGSRVMFKLLITDIHAMSLFPR